MHKTAAVGPTELVAGRIRMNISEIQELPRTPIG